MKWWIVPQMWTSSSEGSIAQSCAGSWNVAGSTLQVIHKLYADKRKSTSSEPTRAGVHGPRHGQESSAAAAASTSTSSMLIRRRWGVVRCVRVERASIRQQVVAVIATCRPSPVGSSPAAASEANVDLRRSVHHRASMKRCLPSRYGRPTIGGPCRPFD